MGSERAEGPWSFLIWDFGEGLKVRHPKDRTTQSQDSSGSIGLILLEPTS